MLGHWLAEPHMREWWGDPEEALAEIVEAMDSDSTEPLIVELDGKPIGYIQIWFIAFEDDNPSRNCPSTPSASMYRSAWPACRSGLGSRRCVNSSHPVRGSLPHLIIDPDPANMRAVRAYEKAGFEAFDERITVLRPRLDDGARRVNRPNRLPTQSPAPNPSQMCFCRANW